MIIWHCSNDCRCLSLLKLILSPMRCRSLSFRFVLTIKVVLCQLCVSVPELFLEISVKLQLPDILLFHRNIFFQVAVDVVFFVQYLLWVYLNKWGIHTEEHLDTSESWISWMYCSTSEIWISWMYSSLEMCQFFVLDYKSWWCGWY